MAGYLDHYGAGEERRAKIIKIVLFSVLGLIVIGGPLVFNFYDWRQEHEVNRFFKLLAAKDYTGAYALWGCTAAKPCSGYSMAAFLQDWGPARDVSHPKITRSRSCGSGVIVTVDFGNNQQEHFWVQRDDLTIGFSPYPGCPSGNGLPVK
ncbi:MAG: hypothetical protein ACLQVN_05125 [Bryobacteraceae bacterium]